MKTILAATDFSDTATNAMNYAFDLAKDTKANLILLHVFQVPLVVSEASIPMINLDEMLNEAELLMQNLVRGFEKSADGKIKVSGRVVQGSVTMKLKEVCTDLKSTLVVMGLHGSNLFERVFIGGASMWALKHLNCPVMIIPPHAKFTSIQKIGLACDMKNVLEEIPIEKIKDFVQQFNAKLHILHVTKDPVYTSELIDESGSLLYALDEFQPAWHFLDKE